MTYDFPGPIPHRPLDARSNDTAAVVAMPATVAGEGGERALGLATATTTESTGAALQGAASRIGFPLASEEPDELVTMRIGNLVLGFLWFGARPR